MIFSVALDLVDIVSSKQDENNKSSVRYYFCRLVSFVIVHCRLI